MLFTQDFLDKVDDDPVGSIVSACCTTIDHIHSQDNQDWSEDDLVELMETAALVNQIIESHNLASENSVPEFSRNFGDTCSSLLKYLQNVAEEFQAVSFELKFSSIQGRYRSALGATFAYEFSQGDLNRVQTLIDELREHISQAAMMEDGHKQRLLSRLEKLQSELHKKVSDLDRFWGLVGDAGVALGKFGKDAKPIVDRIVEISEIVWRTQSRAEELPSGTRHPLIEDSRDDVEASDT